MCDTACAVRSTGTLFAKNSDRPLAERQVIEPFAARPAGGSLRTTYLSLEDSGAYAVLVAEDDDGTVLGFASLSPFRERPAYSTTVEDSVYVGRDRRGGGVGGALLAELVATATAHGFHTVIARIVGGHDASIALHQKAGFDVVGTEREVGRKMGRWLDVVVMQRLLGDGGAV